MEIGIFLVIAIVVVAIIVLVLFFNEDARVKRALRKAPVMSIGDFKKASEVRLMD